MNRVCRELGLPTEIISMIGDYNGVSEHDAWNAIAETNFLFEDSMGHPTCIVYTAVDICRMLALPGWVRNIESIQKYAKGCYWHAYFGEDSPASAEKEYIKATEENVKLMRKGIPANVLHYIMEWSVVNAMLQTELDEEDEEE
jgi:hypothetical protein